MVRHGTEHGQPIWCPAHGSIIDEFDAGFSELRGDIYMAMGRKVDAHDAYIAAQEAGSNSDALRMKLDDLAVES